MNGVTRQRVRRTDQVAARTAARRSRRALTLVDMVVGLVVASVIAGAIGGVLILASRAVPSTAAAAVPTKVAGGRVADDIAAELRYAVAFTEMEPWAVTFEVADRDNDGDAETIRYAWGGMNGDPVTRQYNGSAPVEIADGAENLAFVYSKRKVTTSSPSGGPDTSPETLLASFGGWSGVTPTNVNLNVGTAIWLSQAFRLDAGLMPVNAKNVSITRVRVRMRRPLLGGGDVSVAIHRRQSAGSTLPAGTPVGSPTTVLFADLPAAYQLVSVTLQNALFATLETDLVLVVKGSVAGAAQVSYLNAAAAPADAGTLRWTTDGGLSWQPPATQLDRNDAQFEVYGTWETGPGAPTSIDTYYLRSVEVSLDAAQGAGGAVRASARVLNEPEVAGP
jgi:hypothetical protein